MESNNMTRREALKMMGLGATGFAAASIFSPFSRAGERMDPLFQEPRRQGPQGQAPQGQRPQGMPFLGHEFPRRQEQRRHKCPRRYKRREKRTGCQPAEEELQA